MAWKQEHDKGEAQSVHSVGDVEIVTSSQSSSATSGCDDVDSDLEKDTELAGDMRPPDEEEFSLDAYVKNTKSGIIHAVPDIAPEVSGSTYANGELLQRRTTKCGGLTSSGFTAVHSIPDWTAKGLICFKGCREPAKR